MQNDECRVQNKGAVLTFRYSYFRGYAIILHFAFYILN